MKMSAFVQGGGAMKDQKFFFSRRNFLKTAGIITAMTALGEIPSELLAAVDRKNLVRFPEKTAMILLTDRPPQLETHSLCVGIFLRYLHLWILERGGLR